MPNLDKKVLNNLNRCIEDCLGYVLIEHIKVFMVGKIVQRKRNRIDHVTADRNTYVKL